MITFKKIETEPHFIKGVIFGDAATGKSTFALKFIQESCKKRNINKAILIDTEKGWSWLKKQNEHLLQDIDLLEPNITDYDNMPIVSLVKSIQEYCLYNNVSCIVIDSVSFIGEKITTECLESVNAELVKRGKPKREDTTYADYLEVREKQNEIINILKSIDADILLCGRATSEYQTGKENGRQVVVNATERTLQGWKQLTYEFDFSILATVDFDITSNNQIKKFTNLITKSRIGNDGERVSNEVINKWFEKISINDNLLQNKTKFIECSEELAKCENQEMLDVIVNKIKTLPEQDRSKLHHVYLAKKKELQALVNNS